MIPTPIAPGHWLDKPAAECYDRMRVGGMPPGINDAGRTRAEQQKMWDDWKAGRLDVPTVAPPGTSRHETGNAIDVPVAPRAWLRVHGWWFGWANPLWAQRENTLEPWHWEYTKANDRSLDLLAAEPEDDMYYTLVHYADGPTVTLWNTATNTTAHFTSGEQLAATKQAVLTREVTFKTSKEFAAYRAAFGPALALPASGSGAPIDLEALTANIADGTADELAERLKG